ncbi:hypothetical protein HNR30_002301 [Nonomuraea soli]|uniref:Methylamine utilisation protein MauE domain-containing protein n=1 Tax=Nonomuraea soli TaxID=1032476 RepID=A0A7W0CHB4_9ACTN|nr:MauE/DoxX family redox-associated membrane protein [Nonomuraea soli]MBA2890960.1 hypothetical protein [Nonomuraea soli]
MAAEAAAAVLLLIPGTALAGYVLAAGCLAAFSVVILVELRRPVRAPCRCFGASAVPLGAAHLVRNTLLAALVAAGLAVRHAHEPAHPAGVALAAGVALVIAVLLIFLVDIADLFRSRASTSSTREASWSRGR